MALRAILGPSISSRQLARPRQPDVKDWRLNAPPRWKAASMRADDPEQRWPMTMRMLLVGVVLACLGLVLAGCGSTTSPAPTTPTVATSPTGQTQIHWAMPASSSSTICTVSLSGHDAEVIFSSPDYKVSPACQATIELGAEQGQLWVNGALHPSEGGWGLVCKLAEGDVAATVWDDGGQMYGQQQCTSLLSTGGWTEQSLPATTTTTATDAAPLTTTTTLSCANGFQPSADGTYCVDERHLPCPAGYSGWQNSQINNCLENPTP